MSTTPKHELISSWKESIITSLNTMRRLEMINSLRVHEFGCPGDFKIFSNKRTDLGRVRLHQIWMQKVTMFVEVAARRGNIQSRFLVLVNSILEIVLLQGHKCVIGCGYKIPVCILYHASMISNMPFDEFSEIMQTYFGLNFKTLKLIITSKISYDMFALIYKSKRMPSSESRK